MNGLNIGWACVFAWFGLAGTTSSAGAHDFWIEPSKFRPQVGERVSVGLRVGDHFAGWSVPRSAARVEKFVSMGPAGEQPIPGRDGADPAGVVRYTQPGVYVLGYQSNHAFTEMEAAKFEEYLTERGLEKMIELRNERGASRRKVREAYSRFSKSLIRVGDAAVESGDRVIGFRFEIIVESSPEKQRNASVQSFRLQFDGKPLTGALVTAIRRDAADAKIQARTDQSGRVSLSLNGTGFWLISSVHMIEAPEGVAASWESFWASLTYELPSLLVEDR